MPMTRAQRRGARYRALRNAPRPADVTPNSDPTILSVGRLVVCPPYLVQPDSLYAEMEAQGVVATVARKWAGGTLPKLLWGRSLLYSERYCSMLSWASLISIK
jgi:hypothetical protein